MALVLPVAAGLLLAAAAFRSAEYDESYSIFVTGGIARPDWSSAVFTPAEAAAPFRLHAGPLTTAQLLRSTDVHPPLYFWALGLWRRLAGDGALALRGLSILCALGALLAWMVAAWRAGLPPLVVGLVTALAYGFAYTGQIARGFALAHLMIALCALAALAAWRRERGGRRATGLAALAGLAGGLAAFTNYLAVFPAAAVLAWLAFAPPTWPARLR
ncbi:MAG TPA: hypothetical protein VE684_17080, partial [Crenalkalicoccus sp.]|nr:hypothetical protein [Crenalkalicoccus sp.]